MSKTYKDIQEDIEFEYRAPDKRLKRQYRDAKRVEVLEQKSGVYIVVPAKTGNQAHKQRG